MGSIPALIHPTVLERQTDSIIMPKRDRKRAPADGATAESTAPSPEQEYYDRLIYQCRKDLSKQLKICKSFECQKLIRKVKATDEQNQSDAMQQAYENLKQLPLEPVLDECCRRLGILQLNPSGYEPPQTSDAQHDKWTEKLLQHKRMHQSIEKWSAQATEFRKWCLKLQERAEQGEHDSKRKKTDKSSEPKKESDQGDVSSSLFVQLGSTTGGQPEASFSQATVKKNRPGQRARKAKAAAIQAKEKGMPAPEKSLNWREAKPHAATQAETNGPAKFERYDNQRSGAIASQQHQEKPAKEEKLHPSWEAQKSKKDGIVAFQGKKITFD